VSRLGARAQVAALCARQFVSVWEEWANLLVGCWLIVSPWLLGFAHTRAMHFSIVAGAVVAFMTMLELWLEYETTHFGPASSQAAGSQPFERR
jgi:SPW repeat